MIKREWQKLLGNKILLVVLIAIIAIPTIYTTLFLGSMWDPYGALDQLPVAVVNQDREVTYQDEKLNVGEKLVDNLRDNESLKFEFVDSETAMKGLEKGSYYMVITIPENFSKNAATLLDKNPQKMELQYDTNPGTNYIASKMSESGMAKIKDSVAAEVTKTYAETMFDQVQTVGDGMEEAADGSGKILDGTKELSKGNKTITENLQVLSESTLTFKEGSDELNVGLKKYTSGVSEVNKGAATLKEGVSTLAESANSGAKELTDGASKLSGGVKTYTDGVGKAAQGAKKLNESSSALTNGVASVSKGLGELKSGSGKLLAGMQQMSGQIGKTMPKQSDIDALAGGLQTYQGAIGQLNAALSGVQVPDTSGLQDAKAALAGGLQGAGDNTAALAAAIQDMGGISFDGITISEEDKAKLQNQIAEKINAALGNVQGLQTNLGTAQNAAGQIGGAMDSLGALSALGDLKSSVASLNDNAASVLGNSQTALSGMYSGLATVKSTLDDTMIPGMKTLDDGVSAAKSGVDGDLSTGIQNYTAGVSQVNSGLSQLNENSETLTSGAAALDTGASKLSSGLSGGVKQLSDGTKTLSDGTKELVANNETLIQGAEKLSDGASQISDGAKKLADGSITLGDGITELQKGSDTLKTSLADGAKEVKEVSANDDTIDMFADPVDAQETTITNVENNGHAMAAYMMSVALWVACIAFCIMYPLTEYSGKLKSGFSWWLSKATVVYPISIAMALVMIFMLHVINGFAPVELGKTIIVACIASMAFMSIMYFFNVWLGKVGSFIMLVFMVVQLAGSAGTYPIELSGSFVAKIHKWLPFSYTVDAFRGTIAGGSSIRYAVVILLSLMVVFTILTIWLFQIRARRIKKGKHNLYDFMEKAGLA